VEKLLSWALAGRTSGVTAKQTIAARRP